MAEHVMTEPDRPGSKSEPAASGKVEARALPLGQAEVTDAEPDVLQHRPAAVAVTAVAEVAAVVGRWIIDPEEARAGSARDSAGGGHQKSKRSHGGASLSDTARHRG